MHNSQTHLVTAAMAAVIALLGWRVPAQTTSEPSATRSSVLDAARNALAGQWALSTRSKTEQGLIQQVVARNVLATLRWRTAHRE